MSAVRSVLFFRSGLSSIQGRLTAIAFLFIVGTAVAMGVVGFRFTVNFENERFQDHFDLLASYLASNAELGVLLGNEKILQSLSENLLRVKDVQSVEIFDANSQLIIQRVNETPLPEMGYVSAPVLSKPFGEADNPFVDTTEVEENLGQVRVGYSLTGLELLKKRLAFGFVLLSLVLTILPVFLYWRLSRAIRAPLQDVLKVAGEVGRGRMDVRVEGGQLAETKTLAGAFNEMLDALQQQRRQLREANEAVAKQQVLAEVGKFSMTVAHEIKNPLAIIKGSLGVLRKEGPIDPELKAQMVGYIDDEVQRVNKLVEDFLLFARPRTPVFQELSALDLVGNLADRLRLMSSRILVSVELEDADLEGLLECDVALLERALFNVVRNALEATEDDNKVQVLVGSVPGSLQFAVLDEGEGIAEEDLTGIFEPFFSTKSKGTGLGLAIAKEVLNAHGGSITAHNRAEGGARFCLHIPFSANNEVVRSCELVPESATGSVRA